MIATGQPARRWDLFCSVVDNLGDIGVCWRLARVLCREHGAAVTLWVDHLESFARIDARVQVALMRQSIDGVDVRDWREAATASPAEVVVEGFGCALPEPYLAAMAAGAKRPAWINLEYLSAERWVDEFHARPSPHARLPLVKYFFFPGFTPNSGGLLREAGLFARRDAWLVDAARRRAFWPRVGLGQSVRDETRMSMFAYPHAPLARLLDALAAGVCGPVNVLVPSGVLSEALAQWLGTPGPMIGVPVTRGQLTLTRFAFLDQDGYDELLWGCEFNWVRGEDSFVRAQWAARPMVWNIYAQDEQAHHRKLDAFLERYLDGAPATLAQPVTQLARAWNGVEGDVGQALAACWSQLASWSEHARQYANVLGSQPDLATLLVKFVGNVLE